MILLLISLSLWPPAVTSLDQHDCPSPWTAFNGSCYVYIDLQLRYEEAWLVCRLSSVPSAEETHFILGLTEDYYRFPYAWLGGLVDGEGKWRWMDGSECDFQDWGVYQPRQRSQMDNYLAISYQDKQTPGQWTCFYYRFKLPFVCRRARVELCRLRVSQTAMKMMTMTSAGSHDSLHQLIFFCVYSSRFSSHSHNK
ncbi:snaclec coagulation factor IX/factor X-binding protein subunit A-like isoform X1 [Erpetoichthys calabaricus]|uniref:snaclec coagulation factor IX/factor X-binding protein subunit A-like isoform X1 n=1 Tax=Erpetoichthys calabaricus TaxID=27687 RepID=UPI002234B976|nr:snaclec coagulation factor IX/factor X-binding protein subunit A-like isoform X1 [Erpetoichthys calabaricus]